MQGELRVDYAVRICRGATPQDSSSGKATAYTSRIKVRIYVYNTNLDNSAGSSEEPQKAHGPLLVMYVKNCL